MEDLEVNDHVLVGSKNNKPIYQPVYAFGHYNEEAITEYLRIHTTSSHEEPLEMSAAHLIYLSGSDHPVRADTIIPGDALLQKTSDAPTTIVRVTKVEKHSRNGAYMPLTKSGSIVVNNILASSYVSIMDDAPEVVTKYLNVVSEAKLLHWWLAPYRIVCQSISSDLCKNDYNEDGIAYWLVVGRFVATEGNDLGVISQILCVVIVGVFMLVGMALEALVGFFCTLPGLCLVLFLVAGTKKLLTSNGMAIQKTTKID